MEGRYGWTFPHGFLTLQKATLDAAANAYLLTRDDAYLEFPRQQMNRILELGEVKDIRDFDMSVSERWDSQFASMGEQCETFLVPYRYGDAGWFDWQPISPVYMVTLWNLSMSDAKTGRVWSVFAKQRLSTGTRPLPSTTRRIPGMSNRGFGTWRNRMRPILNISFTLVTK